MEINEEEKKLLEQYQTLSASIPSLAKRLSLEIVPPAIFVLLGLYTGQLAWFVMLIGLLVFFNVQRVILQYKNISKLNSISKKALDSNSEKPKT